MSIVIRQFIISDIWRYRQFIGQLFKRDFRARYAGSLLGIFWNVIHPLMMILIYTLIFSQILKMRVSGMGGVYAYSIYLCSGIIFWNLVTETLSRGSAMFIEHSVMIKKVAFPRIVIPVFIHVSAIATLLITFLIFSIFCYAVGHPVSMYWFMGIPALGLFVLFSFGLSLFIGTLNVYLRDIQQIVGVVLQVWFWFTPIVYVAELIPQRFQSLALLNPLLVYMKLFRGSFYENGAVGTQYWGLAALYSVLALGLGFWFFVRYQKSIVDYV
jgi:lipopolysaccharide transport system permease protein